MKQGWIGESGNQYWYRGRHLHRLDKPAVRLASGGRVYYWKGQIHRDDGPAEVTPTRAAWWRHGRRLRGRRAARDHMGKLLRDEKGGITWIDVRD